MTPSLLPEPSQQGPVADAVADLRSTARWTVGALAAVGALLLGGAPLAALGKVDDWGDAAAAFAGLLIALGGVCWAVWQTSEALTPRIATLAQLGDPDLQPLRDVIARDPAVFYGPFGTGPQDLRAARVLHETTAANLAAAAAREQDERKLRVLQQALADTRANAELAGRLEGRLLEFIHAWQVRAAVRRARLHTVGALAVVVLGAVLFLTAANDTLV